jgi:hypothetical protein
MPVGYKAQVPAWAEVATALREQVPAGILIYGVLHVKRGIAQN